VPDVTAAVLTLATAVFAVWVDLRALICQYATPPATTATNNSQSPYRRGFAGAGGRLTT
jgi:hypothetical protein